MRAVPWSKARARSPARRRSVDFPEPLRPVTMRRVPGATRRLTPATRPAAAEAAGRLPKAARSPGMSTWGHGEGTFLSAHRSGGQMGGIDLGSDRPLEFPAYSESLEDHSDGRSAASFRRRARRRGQSGRVRRRTRARLRSVRERRLRYIPPARADRAPGRRLLSWSTRAAPNGNLPRQPARRRTRSLRPGRRSASALVVVPRRDLGRRAGFESDGTIIGGSPMAAPPSAPRPHRRGCASPTPRLPRPPSAAPA
jgi:hypothetical protein